MSLLPLRFEFAASLLTALALFSPTVSCADVTMPDGHKIIFRYRSFIGSTPSWVSTLTANGNISHATGTSDVAITDRGNGFSDLYATDFDGSTEYVQGASTITTVDTAGKDSFAIQAWVKADNVTGIHSIFSNTESSRGFAMKIIDGKLTGYVRFTNGGVSVPITVTQDATWPALTTSRWYYLVFHVRKNTTTNVYEIRLYVDGVREHYEEQPLYNGVFQSTEKPIVGAEPTAGLGTADFFDGQIYAVQVDNYGAYLDDWVKSTVIRDGGRYFGMPSYHDYLNSTAAGCDYRVYTTANAHSQVATKVTDRMVLPFLNDNYIPQGLGYNSANQMFYVSMYWKDTAGATDTYPTIVAEIAKAGNLNRVFQLIHPGGTIFTGHAGGVACLGTSFYVPYSGGYVYRYDTTLAPNPGYVFNPQTFANPRGDQNQIKPLAKYGPLNLNGNVDISAMDINGDYNGDQILWTADYDTVNLKKINGYKVINGVPNTTASYSYTLPKLAVQGLTCYSATSTNFSFYLSTGSGSTLWSATYARPSGSAATNVISKFGSPQGIEDLAMVGSQVYTVSESGGAYYQKRTSPAPWDELFPLLFGIQP